MTYCTFAEKQHIAAINAGERDAERIAERIADLELSKLGDALNALLLIAQDVMESRSSTDDEKALAEKLIDACGPQEDCYIIRKAVGE